MGYNFLTLNDYQEKASATAIFPSDNAIPYLTLGLTGEAGEVAELIKKSIRDENGHIGDRRKQKLKKELGDVLWYLSQLSAELGITLEEVGQKNLDKLGKRKESGTLQGSGDDR